MFSSLIYTHGLDIKIFKDSSVECIHPCFTDFRNTSVAAAQLKTGTFSSLSLNFDHIILISNNKMLWC